VQTKNLYVWAILALVFLTINTANGLAYNISKPETLKPGDWFNVTVSLNSEKPVNLTIYSYVYKELNCISQGWTANKEELIVSGTKTLVLKDMVKLNTEPGIYNLRVRLKFDNQTINETSSVQVLGETSWLKESYLYAILVLISLVGLGLMFKFNK
jgi:hypothetical protein